LESGSVNCCTPRAGGPPRRGRGFTLIELLVVVVIIGIVVTFAVLSVGFNQSHELKEQAQRLTALIKLAHQESILNSQELAVQLADKGYRFYALNNQGKWVPWDDKGPYHPVDFPDDVEMKVTIEGQDSQSGGTSGNQSGGMGLGGDDTPTSLVYILSSGELTPFELTLRRRDADDAYKITGKLNGDVAMETEKG
jgi:general secretion pathway protein H